MADDLAIKVVLVGDDQDQQDAFDNPRVGPPAPTTDPPRPSPSLAASSGSQRAADTTGFEMLDSVEGLLDSVERLIVALDENTDAVDDGKGSDSGRRSGRMPGSARQQDEDGRVGNKAEGIINRLVGTLESALEQWGLRGTRVGNMVSAGARTVANVGTRASRLAGAVTGRGAGTAATTAAAGAGGAAAGAGAGAAAAGAAATAPIAAVVAPIAAVGVAAAAAALTLRAFVKAVEGIADEIQDLSPQVAAVRAQYEVQGELMRLDRARRLGPQAASLEESRLRLSESMYELQTKIYEILLRFAPLAEQALGGINVGVRGIDAIIASSEVIASILTVWDPTDDKPARDKFNASVEALGDAMREFATMNGGDPTGIDPLLQDILDFDARLPPAAPPPAPGLGGRP